MSLESIEVAVLNMLLFQCIMTHEIDHVEGGWIEMLIGCVGTRNKAFKIENESSPEVTAVPRSSKMRFSRRLRLGSESRGSLF